jgi:hypothetical protein
MDDALSSQTTTEPESVAEVAGLYLGNILYAIELAAMSLEEQQKPDDAAFYRAIARKLAQARGKERTTAG